MVGWRYTGVRGHALAFGVAVFAVATRATAQDASPPREQLGSQRQFVLSVEDVMTISGYLPRTQTASYYDPTTGNTTTTSQETSSSGIELLLGPSIAFDGFIWKHLSVGLKGTLGAGTFKTESSTSTNESFTTQVQHNSNASFVLSPRLGVAWTSESGVGIWARGAVDVTFVSYSWSSSYAGESFRNSDSSFLFGVRGDLLATYSPAPHVVLTGGPFVSKFIDSEAVNPTRVGVSFNAGMFF